MKINYDLIFLLLSLYLLNFGLEMSLEERRRLIAIKKVQGANSKQIFSELRNEIMLLLVVGSLLGYLLGIIAAWVISTITGFMQVDFSTNSRFLDYLQFDSRLYNFYQKVFRLDHNYISCNSVCFSYSDLNFEPFFHQWCELRIFLIFERPL